VVPALEELERKLMVRFRQRSIPFVAQAQKDDWDMLFFKQHYGVPTRLLDWTENPLIGLYFAVMSSPFSVKARRSGSTLMFSSDAAVWVLDPTAWNNHALRHQSFDRGILVPGDEVLQGYKPFSKFPDMNMQPVELYGAHNSPRIVAQRGVFTIFGQSTHAMEQAFDTDAFPTGGLLKLVLTKDVLPALRRSILNQGITESVVFPDLEGLAREIKRSFAFEH
jgi:FRG domain